MCKLFNLMSHKSNPVACLRATLDRIKLSGRQATTIITSSISYRFYKKPKCANTAGGRSQGREPHEKIY